MTSEQAIGGYHHGDLGNALLEAAGRVLVEKGTSGLSLRAVARAAGVSHAAPYRHFRDKAALLRALSQAGFERMGKAISDAVDAKPHGPEQKLIETSVAYVGFAVQHPEITQLMFAGTIEPLEQVAAYELLLAIIREGVEQGSFRQRAPRELTLVAWTSMHGLAMLAVAGLLAVEGDDEPSLDELVRAVARNVIYGIVK